MVGAEDSNFSAMGRGTRKRAAVGPEPPGAGGVFDHESEAGNAEVMNGSYCCSDQCGEQWQREEDGALSLLTLPTVLTICRVAAVPLIVCTFYMDSWWAITATTSIFLLAAITDWLDGYIARKMKLGTAFGAFLDPVADKLMVAATLVLLCSRPLETSVFGGANWLLTVPSITIIGREITMSAVREWAASKNGSILQAVAVNNYGKWKTAAQMTALTILLACRDPRLSSQHALLSSGVMLLYVSAVLALWSLVIYLSKIWTVFLE